jgi:sugar lactone lactonase YvrE
MALGTKGVAGETSSTFSGPCDMAFAANGDIFVADGHVNARVVKFSKDGAFIKAWGTKGDGRGQFNVPHAIAIDSQGRVLVADRYNARIEIFDQNGTYLDEWKQFGRPSGLFIAPDDTLYVADIAKGVAVGSARDGRVTGLIEGTLPEGIAVAADGSVYAGETTTGHTLRKLTRK